MPEWMKEKTLWSSEKQNKKIAKQEFWAEIEKQLNDTNFGWNSPITQAWNTTTAVKNKLNLKAKIPKLKETFYY